MLVIGERINARRKRISIAIHERDAAFVAREARDQAEAGADALDCRADRGAREADDLGWLVSVVRAAADVAIAIDSGSPDAIRTALEQAGNRPIINATATPPDRLDAILDLAAENGCRVIVSCGDTAHPGGLDDRCRAADRLLGALKARGSPLETAFFDPIVVPLSRDPTQALAVLGAVGYISREHPGVRAVCGVSNISFGLPCRNTLNRTFLAMLMAAGLAGVVMDPTEPHMMSTVRAGQALMGRDESALDFVEAARAGRLD